MVCSIVWMLIFSFYLFQSTLLQCRSLNNTRSVWIFVCYFGGLFNIFGPSVTSLGPCCTKKELHTSYLLQFWSLENAVCQRWQFYIVLLRYCDSQPRLTYQNTIFLDRFLDFFALFYLFLQTSVTIQYLTLTLSRHPHFFLVQSKNARKWATFTAPWYCSAL